MTDAAKPDVDPETLSLIRGMLADEVTIPPGTQMPPADVPRFAPIQDTPVAETALPPAPEPPRRAKTRKRVAWRPKRLHVVLALGVAVLLLRPMWVLLALLLTVFAVLGAFVILGAPRASPGATQSLKAYIDRYPPRHPPTVTRLDSFADRPYPTLARLSECPPGTLRLPSLPAFLQAAAAPAQAALAPLPRPPP